MVTFAVTADKQARLRQRMEELDIREADLEEQFIRSSGKGGQHVNKNSTCVQLRHRPTGIIVTCMRERSQSVNRFLARRELAERIARHKGLPSTLAAEHDRIRRRKARKKRRRSSSGHEAP